MMHHQNRIDQAREIYTRFGVVVPDDVLRPFISALVHSDEPAVAIGRSQHPWDRIFVYAKEPINEQDLIFFPLKVAIEVGRIETAKQEAKTFGELEKADPDAHCEVVDLLTRYANYPTLLDFEISDECEAKSPENDGSMTEEEFKERFEELYAAYEEEVKKEYQQLGCYGSRPPVDEDKFDFGDFSYWCTYDGPGVPFEPQIAMHGVVPASIEEEFATLADGVWDGPYVTYQLEDEEKIVAAFEELGYVAVEDWYLIGAVCGGAASLEEFDKHAAWYENLEEMLEGEG